MHRLKLQLAITVGIVSISLLAACGGAASQSAQPAATGGAATGVAATGVAATGVATTGAAATNNLATSNPVTAVPATSTSAQREATPVPCPETTQASEARSGDCDALYQQLLATYGEDYSSCAPQTTAASTCQKPESLESDLKQQINIQLILDSSGSMAEDVGGRTKMDIAKEVMNNFVDTLPQEANVALRVYGHTGSNSDADRSVSCQGSELFYPFQKLDKAQFTSAVDAFEPTGWTPIALALEGAKADFAPYDGATNTNLIYLVSDGIETCDGDPVAAARALHESNLQAVVNIVGFDVDAEAAAQLRQAAEQGGGQYYEARSAEELQQVFTERVNWKEWNEYYGCVFQEANRQVGDEFREQNEATACVFQKANAEVAAINNELNTNYDQYEQCYDVLSDRFQARFDSLVDASADSYREAVDAAQQEYDQAIQEAEQEFNENTQATTTTTP